MKSYRFNSFAIILVVASLGALLLLFRQRAESFPALPTGAYVGTISGLDEKTESGKTVEINAKAGSEKEQGENAITTNAHTLYIEKIGGAHALIAVVFADEWKPQVVPITWQFGGESSKEKGSLNPISLQTSSYSLLLSGSATRDGFRGEVRRDNKIVGTWQLAAIPPGALKEKQIKLPTNFDLRAWLRAKAQRDDLAQRLDSIQGNNRSQDEKKEKLTHFISDKDALQERSRSRREQLQAELSKISQQRTKSTQDLKESIASLGVLHRTSRRGQAVELARRIARRENRWYAARWGADGDPALVEEQLAQQDGIDPRKLQAGFKKAQETQRLLASIENERIRISQIKEQAEQRNRPQTPEVPNIPLDKPDADEQAPAPVPQNKPTQPQGWWNRLENLL